MWNKEQVGSFEGATHNDTMKYWRNIWSHWCVCHNIGQTLMILYLVLISQKNHLARKRRRRIRRKIKTLTHQLRVQKQKCHRVQHKAKWVTLLFNVNVYPQLLRLDRSSHLVSFIHSFSHTCLNRCHSSSWSQYINLDDHPICKYMYHA